jgi:hypothetical protein
MSPRICCGAIRDLTAVQAGFGSFCFEQAAEIQLSRPPSRGI